MELLFSIFDKSFFAELLSSQAKVSLTEKIIIVAMVWWVMGRKVSQHFKALEDKLDLLVISLAEAKASLSSRLDSVEERLDGVENDK